MGSEELSLLLSRLDRIETTLADLTRQRTAKEWYSTAEVAQEVGRSEYTTREWCRKGLVPAEKAANGRGWLISHDTLSRIRNGELPLAEQYTEGRFQEWPVVGAGSGVLSHG